MTLPRAFSCCPPHLSHALGPLKESCCSKGLCSSQSAVPRLHTPGPTGSSAPIPELCHSEPAACPALCPLGVGHGANTVPAGQGLPCAAVLTLDTSSPCLLCQTHIPCPARTGDSSPHTPLRTQELLAKPSCLPDALWAAGAGRRVTVGPPPGMGVREAGSTTCSSPHSKLGYRQLHPL